MDFDTLDIVFYSLCVYSLIEFAFGLACLGLLNWKWSAYRQLILKALGLADLGSRIEKLDAAQASCLMSLDRMGDESAGVTNELEDKVKGVTERLNALTHHVEVGRVNQYDKDVNENTARWNEQIEINNILTQLVHDHIKERKLPSKQPTKKKVKKGGRR